MSLNFGFYSFQLLSTIKLQSILKSRVLSILGREGLDLRVGEISAVVVFAHAQ